MKTDLDLDLLLPLELSHFTPSIVFVDLTVSKYCVDKVSLCTMLSVVLAIQTISLNVVVSFICLSKSS